MTIREEFEKAFDSGNPSIFGHEDNEFLIALWAANWMAERCAELCGEHKQRVLQSTIRQLSKEFSNDH